jgi:type VI protein secretion system component Hcp
MKKAFVGILVFLAATVIFADMEKYAAFIKLDGIEGEADFQGESGWISILRFKIGPADSENVIENPVVVFTPQKIRGQKKREIGSFDGMTIVMTKLIDEASPGLKQAFEQNTEIPEAKLCICKYNDQNNILYTLNLYRVSILNISQRGERERISIKFWKDTMPTP